jgi:serine/threonine-protein kinase
VPEVVADRYEVGDRLGAGGISDVFAAYDRRLERPVAIKFLRTGIGDMRARARFEREARMAASFNHLHAVAIYDVGDHHDQPYLVLEFINGPSLAEMLAERTRLEPDEAVAIADQVLDALGAAHEQGIVHRDVKPANILLTREHVAKLADFGIAKAVADATGGVTMTGELMGTPRYLSPEQVAGHPATSRSDLYAVGVVLYEMLAGAPPFSGETPIATALAHQHESLPSLASRRAGLDPPLVAAVERALEKDPARRFADAGEMRRALAPSPADTTVPLSVGVPADAATLTDHAMLAEGATRIHMLPAPRKPARKRRAIGPSAWIIGALVLFAIVLAILGAVALSNSGGNNLVSTSPPTAIEAQTTVPATTTLPTTTTVPRQTVPPTTLPRTIDALITTLAVNPNAYGSHANDLLKSLQQIQHDNGKKKGENSVQKTIDDVRKWIADGTLDRTIGTITLQLLQSNTD